MEKPSGRSKWVAGILVVSYAILTIIPLLWIIATGFKSPSDATAYPPKVFFEPTLEGLCQPPHCGDAPPKKHCGGRVCRNLVRSIVHERGMVISGPSSLR